MLYVGSLAYGYDKTMDVDICMSSRYYILFVHLILSTLWPRLCLDHNRTTCGNVASKYCGMHYPAWHCVCFVCTVILHYKSAWMSELTLVLCILHCEPIRWSQLPATHSWEGDLQANPQEFGCYITTHLTAGSSLFWLSVALMQQWDSS